MFIADTEVLFAMRKEDPHHKELLAVFQNRGEEIFIPAFACFEMITILQSKNIPSKTII